MAGEDGAGAPRRKSRGFQRAAAAASPLIKAAGASRGLAEPRLLRDWAEIAGDSFAAICRPVRLTWGGRRGLGATLVVSADGPRALEVEHLAPQLIERVNQSYGHRAVSRLKVVQTGAAPTGLAEPPARFERNGELDRPPLPDISAVKDPLLRAALGLLERNIRRKAADRTRN
jgi:hypothetical protein